MKLDLIDNRESQQVRVTLDAKTDEMLELYVEYSNRHGDNQGFTDKKQLIAEICKAFVKRGDKNFDLWLRTRGSTVEKRLLTPKKEKVKKELSREENGWGSPTETITAVQR